MPDESSATAASSESKANPAAAIVKRALASFRQIRMPAATRHPDTAPAQKLLESAHEVVHNMLFAMYLSRAIDRELHEKDHRGRISDADLDILRAAIAFAGAGLDAALKQLIRDTVRDLIEQHKPCKEKFVQFADTYLARGAPGGVARDRLVDLLVDDFAPQEALLARYVRELTGDSLQSAQQVKKVCGALGVNESDIRKRIEDGGLLDRMFRARNAIVHQLDQSPEGRTGRSLDETKRYAREALHVTQIIISDVAKRLPPKKPGDELILQMPATHVDID